MEARDGTTAVAVVEPGGPLAPADVIRQVALIQQVMGEVMRDGEHYGRIPGCGDKPTLLQPGAQVLALTFRLAPRFRIDERSLEGAHREFMVECELYSINSGQMVGMGVGMASTRESKWLYRTGPVEFTGTPVPQEYWNLRKTDPEGALKLIGGKGHQTRKNPDTGAWEIVIAGEKVENDNPADVLNTTLKIATKRAFVHAVLNTTAASDMFTQDVEDLSADVVGHEQKAAEQARAAETPRASTVRLKAIASLMKQLDYTADDLAPVTAELFGRTVGSADMTDDQADTLAAYLMRVLEQRAIDELGAEVAE